MLPPHPVGTITIDLSMGVRWLHLCDIMLKNTGQLHLLYLLKMLNYKDPNFKGTQVTQYVKPQVFYLKYLWLLCS
jgi:hypothetical protein